MLIVSNAWRTAYPGAVVGTLVLRNVANPESHDVLELWKAELESQLRSRYSKGGRAAIKSLPTLQAYAAYFDRYRKTYPVQLQLESVALKAKSIPRVAALVEAMFMAELDNLLLTAGHDLATIQEPIRLDVSAGDERYILFNGQEQVLKPGDMMMADAQGVISSVIYGPDQRTRITSATRLVLFVVYTPAGIGAESVRQHLRAIQTNVLLIAPEATVEALDVYVAE